MSSLIESLIKNVSPPDDLKFRPGKDDWLAVENKLGLILPDDYKKIIETYGDFYWADFIHLLNPFSENRYLNLFSRMEMILDAERETRENFPHYYPLSLFPEKGGLLPVFITDNGDTGFWITFSEPEKWSVLIKGARPPEFEVLFISIASFLFRFSAGNFRSTILPDLDEEK